MKKRILLVVVLALCALGRAVMPHMVESTIPTAYYITPNLKTYENVVSCSGTVQSEDVRQIYLQSAIVAEEVFVAVGDVVKRGDLLVRIAEERAEALSGLPVSLIRDISDDISASGAGSVDWAALASAYGLSAAVSGSGSGIDAAALEELLGQGSFDGTTKGMAAKDGEREITAPIAGVVTEVEIQKGIPASGGKAIITIADNTNYRVIASVKEEDIARVQLDDVATVRGVGFGGSAYTGKVTQIYPTARKALNGTSSETVVDTVIRLDHADKKLKPGFTAKVEISGGSDYDLVTVPYEAIRQDENNDEYVYLYEDGRLVKRIVTTGKELTSEVEILDGVTVDSVVVMNPSEAIREGAMIHIKGRANVD